MSATVSGPFTSAAAGSAWATTRRRRAKWRTRSRAPRTASLGGAWTGENSYVGASYGYTDMKYGIPIVEEGGISLDPRRHSFNVRAGGTASCPAVIQSYRATLGFRRYEHRELEGNEVGTTFDNDQLEGEVLLSHRKARGLLGSVGGWLLNRQFQAIGEEALSPPVDQNSAAGFLYEEVAWPHATLQFGGRLDHTRYVPEGDCRTRISPSGRAPWACSSGRPRPTTTS